MCCTIIRIRDVIDQLAPVALVAVDDLGEDRMHSSMYALNDPVRLRAMAGDLRNLDLQQVCQFLPSANLSRTRASRGIAVMP